MTMSSANQLNQLELDIQKNAAQYPKLDHMDSVWNELSTLKTNDGANFQQDLVQLNKDLHDKGVLPDMEIVDNGGNGSQEFSVVDTNKLSDDIKTASGKPNADMSDYWKQLAAVEKSETPQEFQQYLAQLNSLLPANHQISETSPFKFDWKPVVPPTTPDSSPGANSDSSDTPDEQPWIGPNGSGGEGGGSGGGGGSGPGGGGGFGGGGGDTGGGGSDSSAGSGNYSGTLGNELGDGTTADVVNAAESQIGVPYVWDAENPGHGFDCSGLAKYAWAKAGVDLPHNAAAMYNDTAHVDHVPLSQLKPGDLLFYNDGGSIHHVAIYAGNGKMIEAPHTGANVREVPVRTHGLMPMAGRPHK